MSKPSLSKQIALSLGWRYSPNGDWRGCYWIQPDGEYVCTFPDFSRNLNALHEARKKLSRTQLYAYGCALHIILVKSMVNKGQDFHLNPRWIWDATAEEHAQAFLEAIKTK